MQQDMDLRKQEDCEILSYGASNLSVTFSSGLIRTCSPNILNDMIVFLKKRCAKAYYKNYKTLNPNGVLQKKIYKCVVGFFKEHISGTTNSIYMVFKICVTDNECDHDIHVVQKSCNI